MSEVRYENLLGKLCTSGGANTRPFFCLFSSLKARFRGWSFSMRSRSAQRRKLSGQPSEQKCSPRIPVAPSATLQLPLEPVNYQLYNSASREKKNPLSSASRWVQVDPSRRRTIASPKWSLTAAATKNQRSEAGVPWKTIVHPRLESSSCWPYIYYYFCQSSNKGAVHVRWRPRRKQVPASLIKHHVWW